MQKKGERSGYLPHHHVAHRTLLLAGALLGASGFLRAALGASGGLLLGGGLLISGGSGLLTLGAGGGGGLLLLLGGGGLLLLGGGLGSGGGLLLLLLGGDLSLGSLGAGLGGVDGLGLLGRGDGLLALGGLLLLRGLAELVGEVRGERFGIDDFELLVGRAVALDEELAGGMEVEGGEVLEDLVDVGVLVKDGGGEVLNAKNVVLTQCLLEQTVTADEALRLGLGRPKAAAGADKLVHVVLRGEAEDGEGLQLLEELVGGGADVDEAGAVELLQAELLEGLADGLGDEVTLAAHEQRDANGGELLRHRVLAGGLSLGVHLLANLVEVAGLVLLALGVFEDRLGANELLSGEFALALGVNLVLVLLTLLGELIPAEDTLGAELIDGLTLRKDRLADALSGEPLRGILAHAVIYSKTVRGVRGLRVVCAGFL